MTNRLRDLLTWHDRAYAAVVALMLGVGTAAIAFLPARVAIHWGADGRPDGYGSPGFAALMPVGLAAFLWLVLATAPLGDKLFPNIVASREAHGEMRLGVAAFMAILQLVTLGSSFWPALMPGGLLAGIGLLFILIGRLMPRVKRNGVMGIRLRSTLASDEVWEVTHRAAGRYFEGGGLAVIVAAVLPGGYAFLAFMLIMVAVVAGTLMAARKAAARP